MGSFGDRLKKEREQRGISLDDISLTTKIGTRLLRALEEEKFDQLPGGIFNKGFVRAYARHVGLDEDQTVAEYMTAVGGNQVKPAEDVFPVQIPSPRPPEPEAPRIHVVRQGRREPAAEIPWGILAILLLVIALAFASWSYFHRDSQGERNRVAPAPAAQPAPSAAQPASASGPLQDTQSPLATPSLANPEPLTASTAERPSHTAPPRTQISPVQQAALSEAIPASGTFTVRLKANDESEQSWVSIAVDGKPPFEATLSAPDVKTFRAYREIVVRAGNVGALDVFFNGKPLPPQGDYGEVKTLTFHPEGLLPEPAKPPDPVQ